MSLQPPRMQLSSAGLDFIKDWERFASVPYLDECGYPTVGYGHKLRRGESFPGITSIGQAIVLLSQDVDVAEVLVRSWVATRITLAQHEFDALISFVFNVGGDKFGGSTLLRRLKAGDRSGAADEFLRWDHIHRNGQVVESDGLKRRREAEMAMFLGVTA